MDQELYCIQRPNDVTRAWLASGQPANAATYINERHGRHLEITTSHQKSDSLSRCVFG